MSEAAAVDPSAAALKRCTHCELIWSLENFPPDKRSRDGRCGRCHACMREYARMHREENRRRGAEWALVNAERKGMLRFWTPEACDALEAACKVFSRGIPRTGLGMGERFYRLTHEGHFKPESVAGSGPPPVPEIIPIQDWGERGPQNGRRFELTAEQVARVAELRTSEANWRDIKEQLKLFVSVGTLQQAAARAGIPIRRRKMAM